MARTGNVLARPTCAVMAAGFLMVSCTGAWSNENCQRLEALAAQYAGVELTGAQKQVKRRLVAWYQRNCARIRSADIRR